MSKYKTLAPGVEYYPDTDSLLLIRCPKCGKENYAPNVALGICTWCGYDAHELLKDEQQLRSKAYGVRKRRVQN